MKKRKAARPLGLVSEMVKEAGVEMITDLVENRIVDLFQQNRNLELL